MSVKSPKIDVREAHSIIFQPNEGPQTDFLSSSEQEVLYGGAAGGECKTEFPPPLTVMSQNKLRELSGNPRGQSAAKLSL